VEERTVAHPLTDGETILAMFNLAILAALWGIYSEVRKLVAQGRKKQE
jgi:hypothetical protein